MLEEIVVPFRDEPARIQPAKSVRSTLITASRDALRRRGLFGRYETTIAEPHRAALLGCVAGVWLPIDVGLAHYGACEAMRLTSDEVDEIGADVSKRVQATFLSTIAKMAQSAGATPWTGLSQFQRLWDRVLDGGGVAVIRLGPKDARVEIVALPLLDVPYFHAALRSFIIAGCAMFATNVYGRDVPRYRGKGRTAYRVAWV